MENTNFIKQDFINSRVVERKIKLRERIRFLCLMVGILLVVWALYNISGAPVRVREFLNPSVSEEVFVDGKKSEEAKLNYFPVEGEKIGSLIIPALEKKLPIFQGTSDNTLDKGVGHFTESVMPGEEDNTVLSGHRDTVFTKLGDLKIGDQLIVETKDGNFTYEINGIRIVDKEDKTVIVPTETAVLTLTTCYPFHFIGKAPDRYIITADLVSKK